MVSVTIGLENKELLRWFNEFHAALLKADKAIKEHPDDKRSHLSNLIATTKAIELEMDSSFAAAKVKSTPPSITGRSGSEYDLLGTRRTKRRYTGG